MSRYPLFVTVPFIVSQVLVTFLVVQSQRALAQTEILVPQVVDGKDPESPAGTRFEFMTEFFVESQSDQRVEVRIVLTTNEGDPMERFIKSAAPGGFILDNEITFNLEPHGATYATTVGVGALGAVQVGWAQINADGPIGLVTNLKYYEASGSGGFLSSAGVIVDPPARAFSSVVRVVPGNSTGIAMLNSSQTEPASVHFLLRDHEGAEVGSTTVEIPAHGKIAQFLDEEGLFPGTNLQIGSVLINSDVPLSLIIIHVEGKSWTVFRPFLREQAALAILQSVK